MTLDAWPTRGQGGTSIVGGARCPLAAVVQGQVRRLGAVRVRAGLIRSGVVRCSPGSRRRVPRKVSRCGSAIAGCWARLPSCCRGAAGAGGSPMREGGESPACNTGGFVQKPNLLGYGVDDLTLVWDYSESPSLFKLLSLPFVPTPYGRKLGEAGAFGRWAWVGAVRGAVCPPRRRDR
jgi:hypothetical protein